MLALQAHRGLRRQLEPRRRTQHLGVAVVRDDAKVVSGLIGHALGQLHFHVPDRAVRRSVGGMNCQLPIGGDAHRRSGQGVDEGADAVAWKHLDDERRRTHGLVRLADFDRERLGDSAPQWLAPSLERSVEVAAGVAFAPPRDPRRAELGETGVDELGEFLEGRRPVAVAAAEHRILHPGQRRRRGRQPLLGAVVRRCRDQQDTFLR